MAECLTDLAIAAGLLGVAWLFDRSVIATCHQVARWRGRRDRDRARRAP